MARKERPPRVPEEVDPDMNDAISKARYRVHTAVPYWTRWPRQLRRLYALLDQFGSSDSSIKEICDEFNWNHEETMKRIEEEEGFKEALEDFRFRGEYARGTNKNNTPWRRALTRDQFELVLMDEDVLAQLFHIEDARASGRAGMEYALERVRKRGALDKQRSIGQEAQQVIDRQEKVAHIPIEPDEAESIKNAGTVSGLEWELPEVEKDGDKAEVGTTSAD